MRSRVEQPAGVLRGFKILQQVRALYESEPQHLAMGVAESTADRLQQVHVFVADDDLVDSVEQKRQIGFLDLCRRLTEQRVGRRASTNLSR
jgi:hypothetical protein